MAQPIAVTKPIRRAVEAEEGLSTFSTQEIYRELLSRLGEDPSRDGLRSNGLADVGGKHHSGHGL